MTTNSVIQIVRAAASKALYIAISIPTSLFASLIGPLTAQERRARLRSDVAASFRCALETLGAQILSIRPHRAMGGRYASLVLQFINFQLIINREYFHEGFDFWADISSPANPTVRCRIDVLIRALRLEDYAGSRIEVGRFPKTLEELDALICRISPILEHAFSIGEMERTNGRIQEYLAQQKAILLRQGGYQTLDKGRADGGE